MRVHHLGTGLLVVALGSMLAGCTELEESDVDIVTPSRSTLGGGTSGGHNGVGDGEVNSVIVPLAYAMQAPLVEPGTENEVNNKTGAQMLQTAVGRHVFKYVVGCALPKGTKVFWNGLGYEGIGHLLTTGGWLYDPLKPEQRAELLSCLAAHLNPYGIEVPIALEGAVIQKDGIDYSKYNVQEARWVTTQNVDGIPTYHVLPTDTFNKRCTDPISAITERVCGQQPGVCHLSFMSQQDCYLSPWNGQWYCMGQPAITTWLQDEKVEILHPLCAPN